MDIKFNATEHLIHDLNNAMMDSTPLTMTVNGTVYNFTIVKKLKDVYYIKLINDKNNSR